VNAPRNAYKPWSDSGLRKLVCLFDAGRNLTELAEEFGRTENAIVNRLEKLNLITVCYPRVFRKDSAWHVFDNPEET